MSRVSVYCNRELKTIHQPAHMVCTGALVAGHGRWLMVLSTHSFNGMVTIKGDGWERTVRATEQIEVLPRRTEEYIRAAYATLTEPGAP